ncbi:MAG: exodeoxyribonuclease VII small subunit [Planctomycetes bacterium GWF2_50_10]|nr:MAG: exodeoxyribonuclease VII small subunit [Planctomycetes bacterium GWF2_50_10]
MTKDENKNELEAVSFEAAIKELTEIVAKIEQGQISLESSLSQYERGMDLIKHCRGILGQAQKRIEKISDQGEGKDQ